MLKNHSLWTNWQVPWPRSRKLAPGEYTWSALVRMQRRPQLGRSGRVNLRSTVFLMGERRGKWRKAGATAQQYDPLARHHQYYWTRLKNLEVIGTKTAKLF